jgi:recombination protein RecT
MKTDGSDRQQKTEAEKKQDTLVDRVSKMSREFVRALPKEITVERMMRIVMTAIRTNPRLAECTPNSFYGAMLTSLQLGLEVNTPLEHAFLIPRRKGQGNAAYFQCHFELGYKGLIELCYRTGLYKRIEAEVVYEGDYFKFEYGFDAFLKHIPCGKQDKPIFAWALFELTNGGRSFKVWTWEQAMLHGELFSESFDKESPWKSPWLANPTSQKGMVKKSVLHDALNYAPKSVELARGLNADGNAIIARPGEDAEPGEFSFEISQEEEQDQETPSQGRNKNQEIPPPDESLKPPPQMSPAAEKASRAAAGQEPEPVPASKPGSNGTRANNLFPQDEESALEEQYQQQAGGVEPPEFH